VLVWLHLRRPAVFATVRTMLIVASVSRGAVDLNHGLISAIYNPYAAVPSMHVAYAPIAGAALVAFARRPAVRVAGLVALGLRPRRTIAVVPLRHAARREAAFDSAERAA
jgi:hypothetical protein